jgi:hypothetical protein
MAGEADPLPDWERLLSAERHLQRLVPDTVLVGGTAAALHAGHRVSMDGDHVLADLRGRLDGILTGVRQLRRTRPLETEEIEGLRVPTLAEMARIKAWLLLTRHTVRDYLDTVVLLERLGEPAASAAFRSFDDLYRQASGASPLAELCERLAAAAPGDAGTVDLATYRRLRAPWDDWAHVCDRGRHWAVRLAPVALGENA